MKAITLHQPWASLIALGVKSIETRSWRTAYRGPLAIHAGRSVPHLLRGRTLDVGRFSIERDNPRGTAPAYLLRGPSLSWPYRLPLGVVVAICTLADVVPISGCERSNGPFVAEYPHEGDFAHQRGGLWLIGVSELTKGQPTRIEAQRDYGDFTPGRYAWLLTDVQPIAPVPAVGHQQLWEWTPANEMEMA